MTENQFARNLKKWFWGSFLLQLIIVTGGAIYMSGNLIASDRQQTDDIREIKVGLDKKADVQMVLRIKSDQDRNIDIILQNTQEIKDSQQKLYDALINHISKEK